MQPLLIHVNQAAERLGLSVHQVRQLLKSGRLPSEKVGNRTYIPATALDTYIASIEEAS